MTASSPFLNSRIPFLGIIKLYLFPDFFKNNGSLIVPLGFLIKSFLMSIVHSKSKNNIINNSKTLLADTYDNQDHLR